MGNIGEGQREYEYEPLEADPEWDSPSEEESDEEFPAEEEETVPAGHIFYAPCVEGELEWIPLDDVLTNLLVVTVE